MTDLTQVSTMTIEEIDKFKKRLFEGYKPPSQSRGFPEFENSDQEPKSRPGERR
tara:strand:+ start:333 stop:494 length:162 start_codon:yes stop_codon:yes gene_type:complete